MKIKNIEITNFLSISDLTIDVNNLLIIIGKNNAGKSNILDAINVFFDFAKKSYSTDYFHEKNNANPITIAITFDQKINGESSTIVKIIRNEDGVNNAKYHYKTSNEVSDSAIKSPNKNLEPSLPSIYYLESEKKIDSELSLTNTTILGKLIRELLLFHVETEIDDHVTELMNLLNNHYACVGLNDTLRKNYLFPDNIRLQFQMPPTQKLFNLTMINENDGYYVDVSNLGSGLRRNIIYSILQLYAERRSTFDSKSRIFLFEEPELHLHPQAQKIIHQMIKMLSSNDQVLYTTHSSQFFDLEDHHSLCFVNKSEQGNTTVQTPEEDMTSTIQELRGLSDYMLTYNRAFFSDKIVIVEGQAEAVSLYNFAIKHDPEFIRKNMEIISAGGITNIPKLYKLYSPFIPCYKIFDMDGYFNEENRDKLKDFVSSKKLRTNMIGNPLELPLDFKSTSEYTLFKSDYNDKLREAMPDVYDQIYNELNNMDGLTKSAIKTKTAIRISMKYPTPDFVKKILNNIDSLNNENR